MGPFHTVKTWKENMKSEVIFVSRTAMKRYPMTLSSTILSYFSTL